MIYENSPLPSEICSLYLHYNQLQGGKSKYRYLEVIRTINIKDSIILK